jgi:holo-[acyl-carrier protein] synthase
MTIKTGIDLLEIKRIQAALDRHGERFLERIYTPSEINAYRGRAEALAVCFAAKEAVVKALGTGIGPVSWLEVEILHHASGEPFIILHGKAKQVAKTLGLDQWAVSLSHSEEMATAVVLATGN